MALRALIHNMARDSESLSDMRAAFQQLDTDSDGRVTYAEVRALVALVAGLEHRA